MSSALRVELFFESGEDPIAGRLACGGRERPFAGWLGLISTLQEALACRAEGPCRTRARSGPAPTDGGRRR